MDEYIFRKIAEGSKEAENTLYLRYFELNKDFVLKNNGNHEDVSDNYHVGFIIFILKLRNGKLAPEAASIGYLYTICKNQWLKELRKRVKSEIELDKIVTKLNEMEYIDEDIDESFQNLYSHIMQLAFRKIEAKGNAKEKKCLDILKMRYLKKLSYDEISEIFNKSSNAVRQMKSRCLSKFQSLCAQLEKKHYKTVK